MKNIILKSTVVVALAMFMLGLCMMDSERIIVPGLAVVVSIIYIALFAVANEGRWE